MAARVALVAAGAGARGAFEAGAISVLLPWLEQQGRRPTVFVGTSAGAINAGLLAATADLPAAQSADAVLEFWRGVEVSDVIRPPARSLPGTLLRYFGQVTGLPRTRVISLLDTTPMIAFAEQTFAPYAEALRANIASGLVEALAVVATDADERTSVFCDLAPGVALPAPDLGRALDYRASEIDSRHIVASSAIPALFRPAEIDGSWFTDGGVRLNVPLTPAIALGATDLVVVATHPETYPLPRATPPTGIQPDVVDAIGQLLDSVLADRMVEDLHTLDRVNQFAAAQPAGGPDAARLIPRIFVGPESRHELGELAAHQFGTGADGTGPLSDVGLLRHLLGRRERATGDILSYVFFEPAFTGAAIELGRRYATKQLAAAAPWTPPPPA